MCSGSVRATLRPVTTEVRTPFAASAVELSGGGLYRKQILRFDTIKYIDPQTGQRRTLRFDTEYGKKVIEAFRAGAYAQVPFQLADGNNRHNNDPRNTGGEVVGVELSRDGSGVDGILRLWGDGARVIETNPKLGVSARLFENVTLTDGRTWPVAMQHVLGTVDPQMRDMNPWEKVSSVDLAAGTVAKALDLSAETYEGSTPMPEQDDGGGTVTLELSPDRAARLTALLDEDEALEALADTLGDEFFDDADDVDGEEDPDEDDGDEEPVEMSGAFANALELANAQLSTQGAQIVELSAQLAAQRIERDYEEYMRRGIAPALLELARPLLAVETGAIELSSGIPGETVDPGATVRGILDCVIELAATGHLIIDPDDERGSTRGSDSGNSEREAFVAAWENYG